MENEKGVSNHQGHRRISDRLDNMGLSNHPRVRGFVHGVYHDAVGCYKSIRGNKEGAQAEHNRAR